MENQLDNEKKRSNPILWFIFAIVIPVVIILVFTYSALWLAGVDVNGWLKNTGQKIPVVSSMIKTEEEKEIEAVEQKYEETIEKNDAEIKTLTEQITEQKQTIDQLENEIKDLEAKLAYEEQEADEDNIDESEEQNLKNLSSSFKEMKPKQAALILADLSTDHAIALLDTVSNDVRGKILEAMDPKLAAQLTAEMIDN